MQQKGDESTATALPHILASDWKHLGAPNLWNTLPPPNQATCRDHAGTPPPLVLRPRYLQEGVGGKLPCRLGWHQRA